MIYPEDDFKEFFEQCGRKHPRDWYDEKFGAITFERFYQIMFNRMKHDLGIKVQETSPVGKLNGFEWTDSDK